MTEHDDPDLPRFHVLRLLGAGGGGRVRLVRDRAEGGEERALKVFGAAREAGEGAPAPDVREQLLREAHLLASLRHPGFPRFHEAGAGPDGTPWTLTEHVRAAPPPAADPASRRAAAVIAARGLLDALGHLHRSGWLHRDLKPANVVVSPGPRVVLLDLGLASRHGEATPPRGTLPFVAPEVLSGAPADERSDLFGVGATLLVLACGVVPDASVPFDPSSVPADSPLPAEWLRSLLQPRPERRPDSVARAIADLDVLVGRPMHAPTPDPPPRAIEPSGRRAEIETIERRFRPTADGVLVDVTDDGPDDASGESTLRPIALVRGESGVGKSRLLAELRLRAAASGWMSVAGVCSEQAESPLPGLARALATAVVSASPRTAAMRRRLRAATLLLESQRPDQEQIDAAALFLAEFAAESRGLLVVVEDLQDATAATVRALGAVARAAAEMGEGRDVRLQVVASITDGAPAAEEVEDGLRALEGEGLLQTFPLRGLGGADLVDLVRQALGPRAPEDRIAEILRAHGGALPLFAEEILGHLVRRRALIHDGQRWHLDDRAAPAPPESLLAAVRARIDALPDDARRCVRLTATHEIPVPRARLERISGGDARALGAALASGLVVPGAAADTVALAHAVVGQAALSPLSAAERAQLHDAVAAALPRADPSLDARRAYHVSRGSDPGAALAAAAEAARRLRAEGEAGRAASFVRQALRLLPDRDPRVPRLRRSLAELLQESARPEAAANVYRDLLSAGAGARGDSDAAPDHETRTRLLAGLADALDAGGHAAEAKQVSREALAELSRAGAAFEDAPSMRVTLLARLASAQRSTGDLRDAIETIREGLALAGPGRHPAQAPLLSLLGNVYVQTGDLVRARQFHESCLAACRDLGRRRGLAAAFHNLGVVHARLGEFAEARAAYRQALHVSRRARDHGAVAQTVGNLGALLAEQGDLAGAERLFLRSLALRRRIGDRAGTAIVLGNLAGVYRARGRLGRALAALQTAVRQLRAAGDVEGEARFLLQAAEVHLIAQDGGGARPLLVRAAELGRRASLRGIEAGAELLTGRIERRESPSGDAWHRHLTRAAALFEHAGDPSGQAEALLETALGERDRGRRGTAMKAWRQAFALIESAGSADVRARADLVRGRLESDRPPSDEALEALERFHRHAKSSGRRDYAMTAAMSLGRARLARGDAATARLLFTEAAEADDALTASLPPALRAVRTGSPVRTVLARLAGEAENGRASPEGAPPAGGSHGDPMDQERLLKLLEINKQLNLAQDMRGLLDTIMDVATGVTGAERGFLIVVEEGRISFQAARNFRREEVAKPELKISSSLVKRVLKSGQPVLTDNAREDERFAEFKSVERLELKSILAVPFRAAGTVIGALYLDNPARKGAFVPGDLQFLSALGDQAALAIRNMRHAEQMEAANRALASNLERKSAELETASRALSERATKHAYEEIVGTSQPIREILLLLDKVVDTDVPVLIQGESGTGKELIARAIHRYGRRKDAPFVAVNCGAITETLLESELFGHARGSFTGAVGDKKGLFEAANKGTVLLDEIGEMSPDMQKKLLRVLQEREVRPVGGKDVVKIDVRVIAATNRDLRKMTQEGRFREDLYYRVAVIGIQIPPLRDRADDIPAIVERCMARASAELGLRRKPIDDDAMEALQSYGWPGNVRELDNEIKKALTLSAERITLSDLSTEVQSAREAHGPEPSLVPGDHGARHDAAIELDVEGGKLKDNLERAEKALIERALERTSQNQTRAAKELGISRVWLRKKMEKYGLLPSRPE